MSPTRKSATPKDHKVSVPDDVGDEITITSPATLGEPVTFKVDNGTITVPHADLAHVLAVVEGSTVEGGNPAVASEGN